MAADFGFKPWSLVHYACLRSAVERIKPEEVIFHTEYEPRGPWWELTRPFVTLNRIRAPREVFGNPLLHPAHRADIVRLQALLERGGIYLDADAIVHRDFDVLLSHSVVVGLSRLDGDVTGLCNAVILAEAEAPFLKKWFAQYESFRSKGNDEYWDEHSVRIPFRLAEQFSNEITILPESAFFGLSFRTKGLTRIYASAEPPDLSMAFATHLWENLAWEEYLQDLTPGQVRALSSNFHHWVRPFVEGLPDDFGAPSLGYRIQRGAQRVTSRLRDAVRRRADRAKSRLRDF